MCSIAAISRLASPRAPLRCADIASLQQPDGSFWGDVWGETDTRFSYCALSALWLLNRRDAVDVQAAARYVASCKNFDGGFGCTPGVQSCSPPAVCALLFSAALGPAASGFVVLLCFLKQHWCALS
jgi:prenyltransferase beta subunit